MSRAGRSIPFASRGVPFVWLFGSGLVFALFMVVALISLVVVNGLTTFWPKRVVEWKLEDGTSVMGEVVREERRPGDGSRRRLLRTGNYDLYGDDFKWVDDDAILSESLPADVWLIERREWGVALGRPTALIAEGEAPIAGAGAIRGALPAQHRQALARLGERRRIEKDEIGEINRQMEANRLQVKRATLRSGAGSAEVAQAATNAAADEARLHAGYDVLARRLADIEAEDARFRLAVVEVGGRLLPERPSTPEAPMRVSQVVRAYPANMLTLVGRIDIYLHRWREFLTEEPREANTEGGVLPAIFGTFAMTVILSLAVAPLGVVAALYLREYARPGPLVSLTRIAVNNLAGVPSIVYGVFGLGFFCYGVGGQIDRWFYPERLPAPTFGTGGVLWASLTLALLTVPVVIVATEEALGAVPKSVREGSYACGASRWQTIRRIVLPAAMPGILTGLILAMARGAGEVAPLMLTGVVKLAPELPIDGHFPYLHLERSFMHLGFHIYDVGFQSRNSEAGKPMVYTTTLLLLSLVTISNLLAIRLRTRIKARTRSGQF